MLRTRILAAATAAVLMLGMSVGGAGAAMATPRPDTGVKVFVCKYVGTPGVDERLQEAGPQQNNPISVSVNAIPNYQGVGSYFADAQGRSYVLSEDTRTGGGQQGEPDISECPAPQGAVATASIVPIPRDCDSATAWNFETDAITNATWGAPFIEDGLLKITATANSGALFAGGATSQTFTAPYEEAGGDDCAPPVAVAVVTLTQADCFAGTAFDTSDPANENVTFGEPIIDEEEGTITIVATATGDSLFEDGLDGVSEDRTTRTFTEDYEGPTDDCVEPAIGVTADAAKITCDTDGWFRFGPGLGVSEEDAARIVWTVGPVDYAGNTATGVQHPVTEAVTITVTASLDEESEGDFALSDESGEGVVDPETGDITFTFIFTLPEDCEVGSVVVPEVTKVDECIDDEIIELDLVPSATAVASFTVTAATNVSYTYTINGGSPNPVVFPDGESSVTIAVTPGDTVVVTASAADPFSLPEDYVPWEHTFDGSEACVDLPELANWEVSASGTNEVCTPAGSLSSGSITVVFPVGPIENPNPVRYFIAFGTPQQQELTSAVTAVAPGSYVVTAVPRVPTDSVGDGGAQVDIPITVDAWTGDGCELDTLAFTGVGAVTNWLGVLAVLLTVAGMGFVVRRHRVEV